MNLQYGTNLILIGVFSWNQDHEVLNTYSVEITREGTAPAGSANIVSIHGQYQEGNVYGSLAREGSTFPFVLTRTGDTSESLTVQVGVSGNSRTMWLPSDPVETVFVEFEAGHASARLDVETTADSIATGTYRLYARLARGAGYQVDPRGGNALWFVWEDDYDKLNLADISVIYRGAVVDIGTFDPTVTSYTGNVGSTVEYVTIAATEPSHSIRAAILPGDSNPDSAGHQVDLSYGTNQIIVVAQPSGRGGQRINTYSLHINRAGSAEEGSEAEVSAIGISLAAEGVSIPFLLTRTGDTSEALTAQVEVTEAGGDMVSIGSKGEFDVEFEAGHASARLDVSTNADEVWEEHSTVEVTVREGSSYQVSSESGAASTAVRDDDVPTVTAALTVDSTEVEEGDEITATITFVTDGPRVPHAFMGTLLLRAEAGTAGEKDFQLYSLTNLSNRSNVSTGVGLGFDPVESGGVITSYQDQYSAKILITDDDRPEADESFRAYLAIGRLSKGALILDEDSDSHIITIRGGEETPASPDSFGYATVVVADSGTSGSTFTVTWTHGRTCSRETASLTYAGNPAGQGYAAAIVPTKYVNLGSANDGETQITRSLNDTEGIGTDFVVSLYCSGLVSEVPIPTEVKWHGEKPKPGTYSSEPPLNGLTVSSGTLRPAFSKYGSLYAILDFPNDQQQITLSPTVKPGYTVSWDPATDADLTVPGHQVDLDAGYNTISLAVDPDQGGMSFTYDIIVKRSETGVEANSPATGTPTISGTTQVGQTLTADTTGIADTDGLTNVAFSYQWLADDTEIDGAMGYTYTVQSSDAGKPIKVQVTFTDDAGNEETLTSAATGPVLREPVWGDGPPGAPRNLTVAAGDRELTLSWEPPDDNGNPPATRYRIEWRMDGKDYKKGHWGTSGSTTYTKTDLANGVKYVFRVKAENGNGNSYGPYGPASEEVSAIPTSGSAVDLGTPVLSNTKTLHHGMVRLDWEDIEDAGWYVVQYYHVKSGEWLDLPAAGVDIAFHGSSAVVSNLHGLSWLRVRAVSCAGESEWSQIEELYGTKASDWEGVPVPEVAEGDEIEPCPVMLGTPVLSNTKTLHHGMVRLDWEDIEDAGWYVVQYYHVKSGEWLDLPAAGVDIAFHGSGAVVSNLHGLSWLRVRAMSCAGESEWSQIEELYGTKASDWEGVPVPEVAEGDEIEPCSEDVDTSDNSPATGAPAIGGTAQVGETLTADTSGVADADGLTNATFRYQWLADDSDISGATNATYTLVAEDEGKAIKVQVSFTDDADNEETLTSEATDAVSAAPAPNTPATGAPTINGTAQVGEALTADTSGIADADGLSSVQYEYQWLANDSGISGATNATYTLADTDEGKAIKVEVTFTDDAGNDESLTSAATEAVAAAPTPNSPATGAPAISGTAQVGETLTANTSGVADVDGLSNVQYEYQWLANDAEIAGATGLTYTLAAADEGKAIKVRVSFTDDAGNNETLTSAGTGAVAAANTPATGAPTIIGTAQVGEALTVDTSGIADAEGLTNVLFTYQWLADDADINGAIGSTYTMEEADEGKRIKVKVSFTDDADNEETLTSVATTVVAGAAPAISGAPSYITVEVAEDSSDPLNIVTNFTITWSNDALCSVGYNAYLTTRTGDETEGSQLHLGSAASDGAQITAGLTGVQGGVFGFDVELYCGTDESGRLVSRRFISTTDGRPRPHIYSSEPPLSALSVSHGTFIPTFNSYTSDYTIPDAANADTRITITAIPKTGYAVEFFESSGNGVFALAVYSPGAGGSPSGLSSDCNRSHFDALGPLIELTDADPNAPGFQVDLYDGENHVEVAVYPTEYCAAGTGPGSGYGLAITRAEGSISLIRPNRPPTGLPGTGPRQFDKYGPCVGCTMSVAVSHIRDRDGLDNATFSYQWLADDAEITGAISSSYTVATADLGKTLKVRVSFTDDRGTVETLTSRATKVVKLRNFNPTGRPIVLGTLEVGQTLRADVSGISDRNGMTNATFTYEWINSYQYSAGGSADGEEYTLVDGDAGRRIAVRVNYTDDAGHEEMLDSEITGVVAPQSNNPATGAPTISGTAQVGETLTVDTSGIADTDGLSGATFSYQWVANDGNSDTDITGATDYTYTLAAADEGKTIKVQVSFTDDADNEETLTSAATDAVAAAPTTNTPAMGAPTITGTAQVGETLTANTSGVIDADGLSNVQYEYQWLADDAEVVGATGSTYTLVAADEGKAITVRVSFTDDAGHNETLTSAATDAVAAAEPSEPPDKPTGLSATATHDSVTLTWDDPQDDSITGYVILRRVRENDEGGEFSELVADTGTAATTYTDDTVVAETTYTYRIKATNGAGTSERSRWFHIDIPAAPVPDKPTGLSATATHDQVVLTWDDPGDDSITGYVILRRHRYDDPKGHFDELVADTGTAATTYTDDTVAAGTSYTYRIKAINGAGPGERSRWFHIDTPAAP